MLNGEAQLKNQYLVGEPSLQAPSLKLPTFQYTVMILISLELTYSMNIIKLSLELSKSILLNPRGQILFG
jgi:hypothetical protein